VIIAIYVMMALGLNMVVGYAGLLDLGYVAFFAIEGGATWLAPPHFARPTSAACRASTSTSARWRHRQHRPAGGGYTSPSGLCCLSRR
jgi:hypothetical protein